MGDDAGYGEESIRSLVTVTLATACDPLAGQRCPPLGSERVDVIQHDWEYRCPTGSRG